MQRTHICPETQATLHVKPLRFLNAPETSEIYRTAATLRGNPAMHGNHRPVIVLDTGSRLKPEKIEDERHQPPSSVKRQHTVSKDEELYQRLPKQESPVPSWRLLQQTPPTIPPVSADSIDSVPGGLDLEDWLPSPPLAYPTEPLYDENALRAQAISALALLQEQDPANLLSQYEPWQPWLEAAHDEPQICQVEPHHASSAGQPALRSQPDTARAHQPAATPLSFTLFPFDALTKTEMGMFHVELKDIKNVIHDQAFLLNSSPREQALLSQILCTLLRYLQPRVTVEDDDDRDVLRIVLHSKTWFQIFSALLAQQPPVGFSVDERLELMFPLSEWILAEAGLLFAAGPVPLIRPRYAEAVGDRRELCLELDNLSRRKQRDAEAVLSHL